MQPLESPFPEWNCTSQAGEGGREGGSQDRGQLGRSRTLILVCRGFLIGTENSCEV